VPQQRDAAVGVLVIRASVEEHDGPHLLVQVIEVSLPLPDRRVGIVGSSQAAAVLVRDWLDALVAHRSNNPSGSTRTRRSAGDADVTRGVMPE
jgi:hypothetical protein